MASDDKKIMTFNISRRDYEFIKRENLNFSALVRYLLGQYLKAQYGRKYETFKTQDS